MMFYITALLTGLIGSFHCVVMCGPIALSLPANKDKSKNYLQRIVYNFGRIITYSILGFIVGWIGYLASFSGLQQALSISVGVLVILFTLAKYINIKSFNPLNFTFITKPLGKLLSKPTNFNYLLIGMLNGLLPCGFVYIGLIGASTAAFAWQGMVYMALFGMGTFPLMFLTSIFGQFISTDARQKINRLLPYFAIIIGILFIVRGLNLGIPFLSPDLGSNQNLPADCH